MIRPSRPEVGGRLRAVLGAALGGIAVAVINVHIGQPATAVAGLTLALILPGYVWTLPFRSGEWAQRARIALVLASSIGMTIILGLLLNLLPGGLTVGHWTIGLEAVICLGTATALLLPEPAAADWHRRRVRDMAFPALQALALVAMLGGAAWLSLSSQHHDNAQERFTSLAVSGGGPSGPIVRVMNHEQRQAAYTLVATTGRKTVALVRLRIANNETKVVRLKIATPTTDSSGKLLITLEKPDERVPFRQVWLNAHDGEWS